MATIGEALALALQYHRAGNLANAGEIYRLILQADPANPDALHLLGMLRHEEGHPQQALDYLRQAVGLNPREASFHCDLGLVHLAQGQVEQAIACYRQAIQLRNSYPEAHYNLGIALREQGQLDEAITCYRQALLLRPPYPKACYNLGNALRDQGRREEAAACYRQALTLSPNYAEAHHNLGSILKEQGHLDDAVACFRQAVFFRPNYARAHHNLALTLRDQGRLEEAIASYRQAVLLEPDEAEAHNNLGIILRDQGRLEEAAASLRHALALQPHYAEAHNNLGATLTDQTLLDEAVGQFRAALRLRPDYAEAHYNLGIALRKQGKLDEAVASYRQALQHRPDYPEAYFNLGNALRDQDQLDEASACYSQALRHRPDYAEAHQNLGNALKEKGQLDEAESHLRDACRLKPGDAGMHSSLLMCLNYAPHSTPATLLAEHRCWGERHGARTTPAHANEPDPTRWLRVGYVSPDFRQHPVAAFVQPILAHHDPAQVEVFCYAEVPVADATTARLRSLAHAWRPTHGLSDGQLAAQIAVDGIDLLVDLAGHTAGHRLLVFARKPAPIQLTYLGYPSTTGLSAIDYRLTDAVADPPGEPACHTEELWRLPGCFCCYAPPPHAPAVAGVPALRTGHVTIGSLHNLAKLNERVLDLWCRLLHAIPSACLLICRSTLTGATRERLHRELEKRGIPAERLELRPGSLARSEDYLEVYAEVDVLLDTFPWGGHTTACDALWMGVPVLTLSGDRFASRMVSSLLHCLDLPEWVADTPEEYIERGVRLTGDLDGLAKLRRTLREKMRAGSLCDGVAFTRGLEQAYRSMWRRWCAARIG